MIILAHRGLWQTNKIKANSKILKTKQAKLSKQDLKQALENTEQIAGKNSAQAFENAFKQGFGVETDIRDFKGELVISHDIATQNSLKFKDFLSLYKSFKKDLPLALNIKADGLQAPLKEALKEFSIKNYFVFDMAVPDALLYVKAKFKAFSRQSEYEKEPSFYEKARGIWLDEFHSHFIDESLILAHLKADKKLCIVSPELHKRAFLKEWSEYKRVIEKHHLQGKIMLCTDYANLAQKFFNE